MRPYVILADATCDICEDVRKEIGMTDYLPGHVFAEGVKEFPFTLDWSEISRTEFYNMLSKKKVKVTTAPPNLTEYCDAFEKYAGDGVDIISMSLSSKISSTYQTACLAAETVKEKYPDARIYCFDSFRMSGAFGLLVIYAHLWQAEGKSLDEVVELLEQNKRRIHQMGPIDDLFFVARRGRITMGKAIVGSIVGVKPMGDCSADGYTEVITKVRGIPAALDVTVEYVKQTAVDIENQVLLVAHSDRETYAKMLLDKLNAALSPRKIYMSEVFPGCGANIGPGMVGVFYLGNEIEEGMAAEKEVMSKLTEKK